MSASRDQSQKVAFVYSNLYKIYQKGKDAAQNSELPQTGSSESSISRAPMAVSKVLKAEDLHAQKVSSYNPAELLGKRIPRPSAIAKDQARPVAGAPKHAIVSLKDNLRALNDLHSRLRFMLQELEDLVKE